MASVDQPAVEAEGPGGVGILDLYRSIWQATSAAFVRHRLAIGIEIGLVVVWFLLRTTFTVESRPYLAWMLVAVGVAILSPTSGLVILAATGPFFEPVTLTRALGMRHILVAALGVSVALRLVFGGWRRMPWSPPVFLGIAIAGLTGLGVIHTYRTFDIDWANHAAGSWLASVGGAMIILVAAVWVARDGTWRPVAAAVASTTVAVGLSVADQLQRGLVSGGPLDWIGYWKDFGPRLGGAVPSPNGMAALAVMPVCILAAFAILTSGNRGRILIARLLAAAAAASLFLAMYLTFSRAAILSLFGLAVVVAWRLNRRLGLVVLIGGIAAGIALLPSYLALRGQVGAEGVLAPGSLLVTTDALRLQAWDSAFHMWLDSPLLGQGFLAYKQLADSYGDVVLSSPHNEWLRLFAEEGVVAGLAGVAFVGSTIWWLRSRQDPLARGILAGTFGYFLMASFNNPFLFIQVSAIALTAIGYGLAQSSRRGDHAEAAAAGPAWPDPEQPSPPADASPGPGSMRSHPNRRGARRRSACRAER